MLKAAGNLKAKLNQSKRNGQQRTLPVAFIVILAIMAYIALAVVNFLTSPVERVSSVSYSNYTGSITILDKTQSPDRCAFMYTVDADPAGEKRINKSEPLCKMASIGPAYMEDGYLEYKSLVKDLEAQG